MKTIKLIFIGLVLMLTRFVNAQMILEYDITNTNTNVSLPFSGTVNVKVDWGDDSAIETITTPGNIYHTYTSKGIKTATITGELTQFGNSTTPSAPQNIYKVVSWDGLGLKSLAYAFYYSNILEVPATLPSTVTDLNHMFYGATSFDHPIDTWNTVAITNMSGMFQNAKYFNQAIGSWNTTNVQNMSSMFLDAAIFNQAIGDWNTAKVTNMINMFAYAKAFNQPIGNWNTGAVTNMFGMFNTALSFNQEIGNWNTSKVTLMSYMFSNTDYFNQPIGNWDTRKVEGMRQMFTYAKSFNQAIGNWNTALVTDMSSMFSNAWVFNQEIGTWNTGKVTTMLAMFNNAYSFNMPINTWNTASVTDMSDMFRQAKSFNQALNSWNVSKVTNMSYMFANTLSFNQPLSSWNTSSVTDMGSTFSASKVFNQSIGTWNITQVTSMNYIFNSSSLCTNNYDATLNGWATQTVKKGINFDGGNSKYSSTGETARTSLIDKGWRITDNGLGLLEDVKCIATALENTWERQDVKLYPNPVYEQLNIDFPSSITGFVTYSIFNQAGVLQLKNQIDVNGLNTSIKLNDLQKGSYIIQINTNDNNSQKTFIKE